MSSINDETTIAGKPLRIEPKLILLRMNNSRQENTFENNLFFIVKVHGKKSG